VRRTGTFTQRRTPRSSASRAISNAYLARIEAEGIDRFFGPLDAAKSPSVAAGWRDLSVIGGRVFPWHQPGIGIALPMTGGAVGVSRVVAAMDELASMSDNVEKLAVGGATERHFAIYMDHTANDGVDGATRS
jgi:hypothetical protein